MKPILTIGDDYFPEGKESFCIGWTRLEFIVWLYRERPQ